MIILLTNIISLRLKCIMQLMLTCQRLSQSTANYDWQLHHGTHGTLPLSSDETFSLCCSWSTEQTHHGDIAAHSGTRFETSFVICCSTWEVKFWQVVFSLLEQWPKLYSSICRPSLGPSVSRKLLEWDYLLEHIFLWKL